MKILVVDDDRNIADVIGRGLAAYDHQVDLAHDGDQGERMASTGQYDLILLDLLMPFKSGITVCRELREKGIATPILIVTALDSPDERSRGLEAGANGYLTKPFHLDDLIEQIGRLTSAGAGGSDTLQIGDLVIDPVARIARRGEIEIALTQREFQLLHLLAVNAGRVVSRQAICERIWKMEFDPQSNIIESYVRFLQRKIDAHADRPALVHVVNGVGYRLSVDP